MVEKKLTPVQLTRLSLRVTLLVFNRGLTHLPKDILPFELVDELKSGIRDAHDFLISGAQTKVVATIVASRLSRLLDYDFELFTLYSQAFSTGRQNNRRRSHRVPIEQDGTVIEFPAPAGAHIQSENILRAAAESRLLMYLSAVAEIERLAFNAHRITGKSEKLFHPARDFAHNGEIFLVNATLQDSELRWVSPFPCVDGETRIASEGEFVRQHTEAVKLLERHGIRPGCSIPPISPPSSRNSKEPSKRKS